MRLATGIRAAGLTVLLAFSAWSQGIPEGAQPIVGYESLFRKDNFVFIPIEDSGVTFPFRLPLFAAPLRDIRCLDAPNLQLLVTPETDHWRIQAAKNSFLPSSGTIQLEFDGQRVPLTTEISPIMQSADGSLWLPAHLAKTSGTKLRYEPQPNKNTLGYWVEPTDSAGWQFEIERPGKFNVAVLQGCGSGQAGSTAVIKLSLLNDLLQPSNAQSNIEEVQFEVKETGHFQNFQWLHLSEISLRETGKYELVVMPKSFRKNALMDLRAVHLIWVP